MHKDQNFIVYSAEKISKLENYAQMGIFDDFSDVHCTIFIMQGRLIKKILKRYLRTAWFYNCCQ